MRISDWSSDVCSSDLLFVPGDSRRKFDRAVTTAADMLILDLEDSVAAGRKAEARGITADMLTLSPRPMKLFVRVNAFDTGETLRDLAAVMSKRPGIPVRAWMFSRSEEHTSELQSLMRISYAVFCLKKKT